MSINSVHPFTAQAYVFDDKQGVKAKESMFDGQVACSEFFLSDVLISGRTLDYPTPIFSQCVKFPRGEALSSKDPNGNTSVQWVSKYGFVGLTAFGTENNESNIIEGINEVGLKVSALTLEISEYETVPAGEMAFAMALSDAFVWILGTCGTVDDVKDSLSQVYLWGDPVPPLPTAPGLHFSIHDKNGDSLVVEYVGGALNLYDNNSVRMLTNDPVFPDQLANLERYSDLSIGMAPGEYPGTGMIGLPGDWSTQSRFVRGAKLLEYVTVQHENPIPMAMSILGALEVPKGIKLAFSGNDKVYDFTHWKTISDLANLVFYYSTVSDPRWYYSDLKALNFSEGSGRQNTPIYGPAEFHGSNTPWAIPINGKLVERQEEPSKEVAEADSTCAIS